MRCLKALEVVAAGVEIGALTMACHADVGQMAVHSRRGQHEGAIDRRALRLVHGGGVTMVKRRVVAEIETDLTPRRSVQDHAHRIPLHLGDGSQSAVPHAKLAVVLQKHYSLAGSEVALAALDADGAVIRCQLSCDLDPDLLPKFAAIPEYRPRLQIQLAHVGSSVGQNERSFFRPLGGAVLGPALISSSLARLRFSAK